MREAWRAILSHLAAPDRPQQNGGIMKSQTVTQSPAKSMTDEAKAAYRLSRIYAEGWNHARTVPPDKGLKANPYRTEPERTRWNEGFAKASS
jgi:hypothetical protein